VGPELAGVDAVTFAAADGRRIDGRAYRPTLAEPRPGILFLHGGGFVFGDLDTHDSICRRLAESSGCMVLAVEYRLAPEHPFPAALCDAADALLHVARAPADFGLRGGGVGVAADSAGAHVAIGAMLEAIARPEQGEATAALKIAHAALLYPVVDPRCDFASMHELARGYMLTRQGMQWFWDSYVPRAEDRENPRVDVLTADLAGFPPTTIVTGEFDPLRDEGKALAERLAAAGVPVEFECCAGMIHGFAGMPQLTPMAGAVLTRLGRELGRRLGVGIQQ
jgi:acetyl esterase